MPKTALADLETAENMVVFKNVTYRDPFTNTTGTADVETLESNVDIVATPTGADYSVCHLKSGRVFQVKHDTVASAASSETSDSENAQA